MADGASYYDAIAPTYNRLYGEEQKLKLDFIKSHMPRFFDATDQENQFTWFLDVGCGTGLSFAHIASAFQFGIDPSVNSLAKIPNASSAKHNVTKCYGERLPFRSNSFDLIMCLTAIHNFSHPEEGIKEIIRVARPNCKIVITVLKRTGISSKICDLITLMLKPEIKLSQAKDTIFICQKQ